MTQRDGLCAGRSHAAWPVILDTGRIERVRGPGLIATVGCRCYDRLAAGVKVMEPAHTSLWLRRLEAQV